MKASIDVKETSPGSLQFDDQAIQGDEDVANLTNLSEKDKKKEVAKKEKEDERSKRKGKGKRADVKADKKPVGSSKKSKGAVVTVSEETQSAGDDSLGNNRVALSTGSLKRDAAFVGLSISRMQLDITGKLRDCVRDAFNVDKFFFKGSFLSVEDHYAKISEFPMKWLELKAFIEKI